MSETKHTPGPWSVHLGFEIDDGSVEPLLIFTDDGEGNGLPIAFRDDDARADEAAANKLLIEAAPELLETLKAAHRFILNDESDMGPAETALWNALLDRCEAAISQATGT